MTIDPQGGGGRASVSALIGAVARSDPDADAVLAPGLPAMSYGRLDRHISVTAAGLASLGIRPGDRIAIVLSPGPEMAVALLAVAAVAVAVPLNPAAPRAEFESSFARLRVSALLVDPGHESARAAATACGVRVLEICVEPGAVAGAFALRGAPAPHPPCPRFSGPDDLAVVLTTSGTTARPKIIPLTHRNICSGAANIRDALELHAADRCLNVMPLFHSAGLVAVILASISAGAAVVFAPGFDEDAFFGWLADLRPTWYTAVPTMHEAILARMPAGWNASSERSLRFIRSGSAPLSAALRSRLEDAFGVPVVEGYSMTETQLLAATPLHPERRRPGSVGVPVGVQVAVMDAGGQLLPPGPVGEIVCRGPSVMAGYEDDPEATAAAFCHGWFRTGDEGYLDADGYVFLTGRLKDSINRAGQKVSPEEVDEALAAHPAVAAAVTFAVHDAFLGEDVAAAVVLRDGRRASAGELRRFVAGRLAPFKVPRRIVLVSDLPTNATGKILRREVGEALGAQFSGQAVSRAPFVAPRTAVETRLVEVWERAFDITPIGVTDDFFDLGGDSLLAAAVMTDIEELYGQTIRPSALFEAPTVEALAKLVTAAPVDAPVRLLKTLQPGRDRPSFIMVDGDAFGHGALYCVTLSRLLGPRQPFHTLSSHGTNGAPMLDTIEAMAADHVLTLRTLLPDGPYVLGGYSHGGLVAFEMARQLTAAGHDVLHVVIVDIAADESARLALAAHTPASPVDTRWRRTLDPIRIATRRVRRSLGAARRVAEARHTDAWRSTQWATIVRIVGAYVPRPYDGPVTLLVSRDGRARQSTTDPTLGWRGVATDLRTIVIPGDHQTCITTHLATLAQHLAGCLSSTIEPVKR